MRYCALESACYSGKTTTIRHLKNRGIPILIEPRSQDGLPADAQVGAPLSSDFDGYKAKIDALIKVEAMRVEAIDRQRSAGTELLVADRSPLATIVFEDMAIRYGYGDQDDRRKAREYAIRGLDNAVRAGEIVLPNCLVIISLEDEREFYRRVEERGPIHISQLSAYEPSRFMTGQTAEYAATLFGESAAQVRVTGIDTQQEVSERVLSTISDFPLSSNPQSFGALL